MSSSTADRLHLIDRSTEEVLGHQELARLIANGQPLRHYIGFEISGKVHLGTGLVCMSKVKDFLDAGVECTVLLADWHTWINDKLGGDRAAIRGVASGYFREALRASLAGVGGDPARLRFVLASDLYHNNDEYWATVIDVSRHTTLARMQRSITILGRREGDSVDFAKLIYPAMQVADIFALGVNLAHAGADQRKAHVIARDVALQLVTSPLAGPQGEPIKPVAVHHPLLLGLGKPPVWPAATVDRRELRTAMKMSKSTPASAVLVHDPPEEIERKITRAFCPPQEVEFNPIIDWVRQLVFGRGPAALEVDRSVRHGGPVTFTDAAGVAAAYAEGRLHPGDLKPALARFLIELLEPVRRRFEEPGPRRMLAELDQLAAEPNGKARRRSRE